MNCFLALSDGSCKPNPGYSGFGIFGYSYEEKEGKRPYKHPGDAKYYFTETGISDQKSYQLVVQDVYEHIEFIRGPANTNNHSELLAVTRALELALPQTDLQKVTVITDSGYVVNCYNDSLPKWKDNAWKRIDNKDIIHISEWVRLDSVAQTLIARGVTIDIQWTKGHADNYGNYLADLFSVVGSNCASLDALERIENQVILSQKINYLDYCKSYEKKDLLYHFKELYFNSSSLDDTTYCFLYNTTDVDANIGRKNTESLFALNVGYIPPLIHRLKELQRSLNRSFTTTCSVKLGKLTNKDILRLFNYVDPKYMVYPHGDSHYLIRDNTPFVCDVKANIPLIMNVNNVFGKVQRTYDRIEEGGTDGVHKVDITAMVVSEGKLAFTNQVTSLDISQCIKDNTQLEFVFKQTVYLNVGYDIPAYLVLKNIESQITQVLVYISVDSENTLATVYCKLILDDRELLVTNILNKFSVRFLDF